MSASNRDIVFSYLKKPLVIGLIFVLIFSMLGVWFIYRPNYSLLYSGVEQSEASKITKQLKELNIPFQLSENGTAISVNENVVQETRINLAGEGVSITEPVGFEIFDDADFGLTEFAQKVNYQRAVEGELARTISSSNNVKQARVHLSIPEKRSFQKEEEPVKASITVITKENKVLSKKQVVGIKNLVSSSVVGLQVDNITLLNGNGDILAGNDNLLQQMEEDGSRLHYQKEFEEYFTGKIVNILSPVLGEDNFQVGVHTQLDFDKVRSTKRGLSNSQSGGSGFLSRRYEKTDESSEKKISQSKGKTLEEEYTYGNELIETETATGKLVRLSIAVLVIGDVDESDLESIRLLVASASGIQVERGDVVTVKAIPRHQPSIIESKATPLVEEKPSPAIKITSSNESTPSGEVVNKYSQYLSIDFIAFFLFISACISVVVFQLTRFHLKKKVKLLDLDEKQKLLKEVSDWIALENNKVKGSQ
ncbi:flagellar basal-body MS-ring/collar protein FliF [Agarivorans sp. DSG3-1]|uniref:flagellar basal-body MS-ring/collar protein FliF n=1 Tax=Agarivorans sp. DSG3-1 TaxID=3342249 RepID=UPI00398F669C